MENLMHGEISVDTSKEHEVVVMIVKREEGIIKESEAMEWKRLVNGVEQR